uniref:Uncharacterized protein n=1 Tax=Micromonas pusilla TaxID=38833 RepID=A0A7R9TFE8_MICPS|mmetsp:Transcript_14801/g.53212  ORF Transcript_14801/g.53212 Transcript_14801/m.53212 type:complete len:100 (+) Transcript_14801:662-961(+)
MMPIEFQITRSYCKVCCVSLNVQQIEGTPTMHLLPFAICTKSQHLEVSLRQAMFCHLLFTTLHFVLASAAFPLDMWKLGDCSTKCVNKGLHLMLVLITR